MTFLNLFLYFFFFFLYQTGYRRDGPVNASAVGMKRHSESVVTFELKQGLNAVFVLFFWCCSCCSCSVRHQEQNLLRAGTTAWLLPQPGGKHPEPG